LKLKIDNVVPVLGTVPTVPLDAFTTVGLLDSVTVPEDSEVALDRVTVPDESDVAELKVTVPLEIAIAEVSWIRPDDAETICGALEKVTVPLLSDVALDKTTVQLLDGDTIPDDSDVALDNVTVPLDRLRTVAACATVICPEALTPRMLPLVAKSPMVITCRFVDEVMTIASMNCPLVPTAGGTWTTAI
jgi:hypothetical protein